MDTLSKVVLGCTGSIVAICIASYARTTHRSKVAIQALDTMEVELKAIRHQFNEADISRIQAERAIDIAIEKAMLIYMHFTFDDRNQARLFFETHRENNKKLLGFPA